MSNQGLTEATETHLTNEDARNAQRVVASSYNLSYAVTGSLATAMNFFPPEFSVNFAGIPRPIEMRSFYADNYCCLKIAIAEEKLPHLARDLFRVRVESGLGGRCVVFPNSAAKAITDPFTTIRGVFLTDLRNASIGDAVHTALPDCPNFQRELPQCLPSTSCVSITIPCRMTEPATLEICLGLWIGLEIQNALCADSFGSSFDHFPSTIE